MPDEPMTLVERLRNPERMSGGVLLNTDRTTDVMRQAATMIELQRKMLKARSEERETLRESVRIRDEEIDRLRAYCSDWAKDAAERHEAALTTIRDTLPIQNDEYARHVFAIAANALEPNS